MTRSNSEVFNTTLPDKIVVSQKNLKKRPGAKTTEERRRLRDPRYRHVYSDAKKLEVACAFAVCGNSRACSELANVPEATIRTWKTTEWWQEIMLRIHQEEDEELDTKLTSLVNKAVGQVNDRLDNGDWVYNTKKNELVRKPISARDAAIVTAITIDKRQLLRGQPTSRVEKVNSDERLSRLAKQFADFTNARTIEQVDIPVALPSSAQDSGPIEQEQTEQQEGPTINQMFGE